MKKIRENLLDKYHEANEDDNRIESDVFETYNGDMSDE